MVMTGKTLTAPRRILLERLRDNKGAKILAPIRASRERLLEAEKILQTINIYDPNPKAYRSMLQLVRAASMNCYSFEAPRDASLESRASLLQRRIGFSDACTYRLIAKNVTVLLTQAQSSLRQGVYKALDDLINSYHLLDDMLDRAIDQDPMAVERVPDALQFTTANVSGFESLIERCLDLPISNLATMPGEITDDGFPKEQAKREEPAPAANQEEPAPAASQEPAPAANQEEPAPAASQEPAPAASQEEPALAASSQ